MASNTAKSKFRGVYKCGKRWKAQLQCQGIQFYLGTFDTESEAAKAYDRKARDEKGIKGLTNFDENGEEAICISSGTSSSSSASCSSSASVSDFQDMINQNLAGDQSDPTSDPPSFKAKRPKLSSSSASSSSAASSESAAVLNSNNNSVQVTVPSIDNSPIEEISFFVFFVLHFETVCWENY